MHSVLCGVRSRSSKLFYDIAVYESPLATPPPNRYSAPAADGKQTSGRDQGRMLVDADHCRSVEVDHAKYPRNALQGHSVEAISSCEIQIVPRHSGPPWMDCRDIPLSIRSPICKRAVERKTPLFGHTDDVFAVRKEPLRLGPGENTNGNPFRGHFGILPAPRKVRHDY